MREGWKNVKLGDVCKLEKNKHQGNGLAYVGLEHIESGTGQFLGSLNPVNVRSVTFCFDPQHILFGRLRPYLNKVFLPDFKGHCSSEIFPLKVNSEILKRFLYYWITSQPIANEINRTCTGTRMPRANVNEVMNFEINLPPIPEQKRIVAILDEAFAEIEKATANTEKNITNSLELFDGYRDSIFQKKFEIWGHKELGNICENLDSKRVPITKSKRTPGDIPYYGASGIVDYVNKYLFDEDLLLVSEDGANLLARTYPIAFSISGKSWVNNHAHVLRVANYESQKFIEYYLNSISLAPYVSGMAQPKLNQKALNSIPVPFPEIDIQREVVQKLDDLSVKTKELGVIYRQKLTALAELKQSLLQKAFSGELTSKSCDELEKAAA